MAAPKQVDFVDGTTVVSAGFLDRIQEVQAGLATNAALAVSGTNVVMNAGSGNDVSAMVIDERMRYVESPQIVSFSGSDSSGSYSIWATTSDTDSNSGFTLVKTLGTATPTADNFRRVGTVSWDGSALSSLVQLAGYDKHGHMHALSSDPLPAGSVSSTQIVDGTVTVTDLAASLQQLLVPTGTVMPFAGAAAPSSYLLCDGAPHSRSTFAALFAALGGTGSPYGLGDGSTTFNVPDLRGRVVAGRDNMGTAQGAASRLADIASTLGSAGGTETHQLTATQSGIPAHTVNNDGGHTHTVSNHDGHGHTASTGNAGGHGHNTRVVYGGNGIWSGILYSAGQVNQGTVGGGNGENGTGVYNVGDHSHTVSVATGGSHSHTVSGGGHTHTVTAAGASSAHPNVQPTMVMNYIIKI